MPLIQRVGKFEIKGVKKIILVLDTSESAQTYWNEIASFISQLISILPKDIEGELYFLGNSVSFDISQFEKLSAQLYEENRSRISLVTPIFEKLKDKQDIFNILIIGSGTIFDLEDWIDTPLMQQTLLVSVKESLQGEKSFVEEVFNPSVQEIYSYLYDPIVGIEISGKGFMPLKWSNEGYYLTLINGQAYLRASKLDTYSVILEYLIESDFLPQAQLMYASGQRLSVTIQKVETEKLEDSELILLTSEEEKIFEKAILQKSFICPYCSNYHQWDTLYCLNTSSILGELIYSSLNKYQMSGLVLFYQKGGRTYFQPYKANLLRIDENAVAIREGRRAIIYKYDERTQLWEATSQNLTPYYKLKEGVYAVVF